MVETLAAMIGGGLAVFVYLKSKKSSTKTFTIKSDQTVKLDGEHISGYKPIPTKPKYSPPPQYPKVQSGVTKPQLTPIDMKGVTEIRLEGVGDIIITPDKIDILEDSEVKIKNGVLTVSYHGASISINNNIIVGSSISINGNKIVNGKQVKLETYQLTNFDKKSLNKVTLKGSGDITIGGLEFANNSEILVQGSGDITIEESNFHVVVLHVKGSGDIEFGKKCVANGVDAVVKGSGDITIRNSKNIKTINKNVMGSGDINIH